MALKPKSKRSIEWQGDWHSERGKGVDLSCSMVPIVFGGNSFDL